MQTSLCVRLTMLLVGAGVLVGMVVVLYEETALERILSRQLEQQAADLARGLGSQSMDHIQAKDWRGLSAVLSEGKRYNDEVRYIVVFGPAGQVVAHTFEGRVPDEVLNAAVLGVEDGVLTRRLTLGKERVMDVAAPILGGGVGTVRVGLGERDVRAAVVQNTRHLIIVVACVVAAGTLVAFGIAYFTTRPLRHLSAAIRSVSAGDFSKRVAVERRDEVGQLQAAFNTMALELEVRERARRKLLERSMKSQEEERKRVARELHDGVAQQLTAIRLGIEATERAIPEDGVPMLELRRGVVSTRAAVDTCLTEARRLMADLRPALLDHMGLKQAILSYAEDQLVPTGSQVECDLSGVRESLPPHVEIAVFRILQEAIGNAARHSGATQITVRISAGDRYATGSVTDNGKGFQQGDGRAAGGLDGGHLGIVGMRERASLLGGALTVTSREGLGTEVTFAIPIHGERQAWNSRA
ncbi:MAG: HAMP domain-containing protein [Chloroflexota bacterium]|nr:HAMP domain-containing protein [Chloroflexota bacterium]